jgi:hypothetical protein
MHHLTTTLAEQHRADLLREAADQRRARPAGPRSERRSPFGRRRRAFGPE